MDGRTYNDRPAVPRWAVIGWLTAFGAPLVGLPILVGLLALGSSGEADAVVGDGAEQVTATVHIGAQNPVELPPVTFVGDHDVRG